MQKAVTQFQSSCGRVKMFIDNDTPIGVFHDYLMEIKGLMVERMIAAHQEQVKEAEAAKQLPPHESELSALSDQQNCTSDCAKE